MAIPKKLKELAKKYKVKLTYKRKGKRYNKTEKMLSNIIASKVDASQKYYLELKNPDESDKTNYEFIIKNDKDQNNDKNKNGKIDIMIEDKWEDDATLSLDNVRFFINIRSKGMCSSLVAEAIRIVLEKEKITKISEYKVYINSSYIGARICYINAFKKNGLIIDEIKYKKVNQKSFTEIEKKVDNLLKSEPVEINGYEDVIVSDEGTLVSDDGNGDLVIWDETLYFKKKIK